MCSAGLLLRLGGLVDRWALPRVTLMAGVMLAAGCLMLGGALHTLMVWLGFFLVRFGGQATLSHKGAINATLGALWPERYGIRHIGAIRSVMQAIMVLSSALAPILLGFMLDAGVTVNVVIGTLAVATALAVSLAQWGIWRSP